MRETELAQIDLNLLVILRALLETRGIGRTAIRLNMSQPAVSRALARLRLVFDDRLLVKAGAGMLETPRAAALLEPVRKALAGLEEVLGGGQLFDPETSERVFRVASTDYGASAVLPSLMARITAIAPLGGIEIVPMTPGYFRDLGTGERDLVSSQVAVHRRTCALTTCFAKTMSTSSGPDITFCAKRRAAKSRWIRISPGHTYS